MKTRKPHAVAPRRASPAAVAPGQTAPLAHGPTEAIARQVARKWSASFGVADAIAITRLESALVAAAFDAMFDGTAIVDLERLLDEAAHILIADWLAGILQKPVGSSAQAFAEARLAFLTVNGSGDWSRSFLDAGVSAAELRQAMETVRQMATPPQRQQEIRRQSL